MNGRVVMMTARLFLYRWIRPCNKLMEFDWSATSSRPYGLPTFSGSQLTRAAPNTVPVA